MSTCECLCHVTKWWGVRTFCTRHKTPAWGEWSPSAAKRRGRLYRTPGSRQSFSSQPFWLARVKTSVWLRIKSWVDSESNVILLESWADVNRRIGKNFKSWVDLNQYLGIHSSHELILSQFLESWLSHELNRFKSPRYCLRAMRWLESIFREGTLSRKPQKRSHEVNLGVGSPKRSSGQQLSWMPKKGHMKLGMNITVSWVDSMQDFESFF